MLKKSRNGAILIVLTAIVLLGIVGCDKKEEPKNQVDYKLYAGAYAKEELAWMLDENDNISAPLDENEDGKQDTYYNSLFLREDGSFLLSFDGYMACYSPSVGTYTIDNGVITLKETVHYGCDACFYNDNLKTYKGNIKDNGTITINYNDKVIELKKGIIEPEDESSLSRYVPYPKDGETPKGWGDPWSDCNNK